MALAGCKWKPVTLGAIYLSTLILFTALSIGAVEVTVQTSGIDYSLASLSQDDHGSLSTEADFVNLYLPTILSVLYNWPGYGYVESGTRSKSLTNLCKSSIMMPNGWNHSFGCLRRLMAESLRASPCTWITLP